MALSKKERNEAKKAALAKMSKEWDLDSLLFVRQKLQAALECPASFGSTGICSLTSCSRNYSDINRLVFASWKHFSGYAGYPVAPHKNASSIICRHSFESSQARSKMWSKHNRNGEMRRKLAKHYIKLINAVIESGYPTDIETTVKAILDGLEDRLKTAAGGKYSVRIDRSQYTRHDYNITVRHSDCDIPACYLRFSECEDEDGKELLMSVNDPLSSEASHDRVCKIKQNGYGVMAFATNKPTGYVIWRVIEEVVLHSRILAWRNENYDQMMNEMREKFNNAYAKTPRTVEQMKTIEVGSQLVDSGKTVSVKKKFGTVGKGEIRLYWLDSNSISDTLDKLV